MRFLGNEVSGILDRLRYYRWALMQDMGEAANRHYQIFKTLIDTLAPYIEEIKGKNILDIGCGRLYPLTLLLHSFGGRVVGIDTAYIGANTPFIERYWKELRKNDLQSFARGFLYGVLLKNKTFYRSLRKTCDFPLITQGLDIRQMSAQGLLFPDEMFDIAISINVFEHVTDVARAVSELSRVMKNGGAVYINIHLFTSLSGGHRPDSEDPRKVPPWDHLRQRRHALPCYLNKLREQEYLSLFRERFEILRVIDIIEEKDRELLTREIRHELQDYSEQELLKRCITIVARK